MITLNDNCNQANVIFVIVSGICTAIEAFLMFVIGIIIAYKIIIYHKSNRFPIFVAVTQFIFYTITIVLGIGQFLASYFGCTVYLELSNIITAILFLLRIMHIVSYEMILFARLIHVFEETIYQIDRK
eukprot:347449_1